MQKSSNRPRYQKKQDKNYVQKEENNNDAENTPKRLPRFVAKKTLNTHSCNKVTESSPSKEEVKEVEEVTEEVKETIVKDGDTNLDTSLKTGKLIKNSIIRGEQDEKFFVYSQYVLRHKALVGDTVSYKIIKNASGSRLANADIIDVIKRGQRFYLAFIVEENQDVKSQGYYKNERSKESQPRTQPLKVMIYGSELSFEVVNTIEGLSANSSSCCLVTFVDMNKVEIVKDLSLYENDEILRCVHDLEELEYTEPIKSILPSSSASQLKNQTHLYTFTIDPISSKDFDDALSIDTEMCKVYVHIADVGRYVSTNSRLDQRLKQRQYSVYLTHRVYHMSPHRLATDVCSLNPNVDRCAATIEFSYDPETYKIQPDSFQHYRSLICSKRRFHYDEVDEILASNDEKLNEFQILLKMQTIFLQNKIQKTLKDNMPELKTVGKQRQITVCKPDDSHEMVEFYMLTANQYVASYLDSKNILYPKRYHPQPFDISKFENVCKLQLPSHCPKEFHVFLKLTCMQPACYTIDENKQGHFALGMQYYTHFTSPIRRYVDIVNHRLLFDDYKYTNAELQQICKLANEQEAYVKRVEECQSNLLDCEHARQTQNGTFTGIVYALQPKFMMVYIVETMMTTQISIKQYFQASKDYMTCYENQWIGKYHSIKLYDQIKLKIQSISDKVYYKPLKSQVQK